LQSHGARDDPIEERTAAPIHTVTSQCAVDYGIALPLSRFFDQLFRNCGCIAVVLNDGRRA
jgi:hypothetical protein